MDYYLSPDPRHTIAGAIRALARFTLFSASFAAMAALAVSLRAVLPSRLHSRLGPAARRLYGRTICRAAGVRVRRVGACPADAAMLVSNHISWLDSFLFLGETGARFVANATWGEIPVLGTVLRSAGVIFIRRSRLRDIREVGHRLSRFARGRELAMVFPEADTSRGASLLDFRPGLLEPVVAARLSCGWCALSYETPEGWPPASVVVAWADWTPLLLHIYRALYPPRLVARITFGEVPVVSESRKTLAASLQRLVQGAHRPMEQLPRDQLERLTVPPPTPPERF